MRQIRAARNVENLKSEACMDIIFPILTPHDFSLNSNSNLTGSWVSYTFILSNTMQGNVYETPYTFNFLVWGIEEWPYMPRRKVHLSRILHMSKTKQKGDALWRKEGKDVTAILWSSPPTSWNLCLKNSLSPRLYLYKSKYKYHLFFAHCSAVVRKLISNGSELSSDQPSPHVFHSSMRHSASHERLVST